MSCECRNSGLRFRASVGLILVLKKFSTSVVLFNNRCALKALFFSFLFFSYLILCSPLYAPLFVALYESTYDSLVASLSVSLCLALLVFQALS